MRSVVLVLGLILLASCGGSGGEGSEARALTGRLAAPDCGGGFEIENAQVVLRNQANDIVGTATTGSDLTPVVDDICVVDYKIADVPDAKFYSLKIGTHEGPAWSASQLESQKFRADLALGDAEIPSADTGEFCGSVEDLNNVLHDVDTLNNHAAQWRSQLTDYANKMTSLAAGLELADKDEDSVSDLVEVSDALTKADPYMTVGRLNSTLDPVNLDVPQLMAGFHCPGGYYWDSVGYSAG